MDAAGSVAMVLSLTELGESVELHFKIEHQSSVYHIPSPFFRGSKFACPRALRFLLRMLPNTFF